ncbi:MAG: electron transport complex subunit RsxG [Proteobacteria bacterium]|nr:electron transport complex subunit RsxG [Pseudomonadota bacterium]
MNNFIKLPLILATLTFLTSGLIMFSESATRDKIAEQKKQMLLDSLKQLIPDNLHDNDLTQSTMTVFAEELLGHRNEQVIYIGKLNGVPSVYAIPVTSRSGYSGDIDIMVGIKVSGDKANGKITSVKILEQHETPGLGDLIQANKSDWIQQFPNQSLQSIDKKLWKVKRDGGKFDQITGATISPRAVVWAIKQALLYQQQHLPGLSGLNEKNP